MTADTTTPPRYYPKVLERAVIEEALYLHPQHVTREEFVRKVTGRSDDPGRGNDVIDAAGEPTSADQPGKQADNRRAYRLKTAASGND